MVPCIRCYFICFKRNFGKSYAELEFWFSSIKVVTILAFVVLGGSALLGFISYDGKEAAPLFSNFVSDGGLFPNGLAAVLLTMITVNFSFQGTELIGIAAGESENPEKQFHARSVIQYGALCYSSF